MTNNNYNPFSLEGKTILVTGASSGIGRATAIECAKMGATLIINGRNSSRLDETFSQLAGAGHHQCAADLNDPVQVEQLLSSLSELTGIVHCAGIGMTLPFLFINETHLRRIFEVNFDAPALITQKILKTKKLRKGASIVLISSVSGMFCAAPGGSLYSASKGALEGLAKGMALDLAPKNIRVNCVNPGVIETNIFSEGIVTAEQLETNRKLYPLKRFGKPEEVAYAVIYLLSDASRWVTGANIRVDGGFTLL